MWRLAGLQIFEIRRRANLVRNFNLFFGMEPACHNQWEVGGTLWLLFSTNKDRQKLVERVWTRLHVGSWWGTNRSPENGYHGAEPDKSSLFCIHRPSTKASWDSWDGMHLIILRGSCPALKFGHEKTVSAIGTGLAHCRQQMHPWDYFEALFDALYAQSKGSPASFRDC